MTKAKVDWFEDFLSTRFPWGEPDLILLVHEPKEARLLNADIVGQFKITKENLYNVIEESIWTIFGTVMLVIYLTLYSKIDILPSTPELKKIKSIIPIILIVCTIYILFMTYNDVPMYFKRAQKQKENNVQYNSLYDGIQEMKKCKKVTSSYQEWKSDIPWLTFYFTFTVWGTIYILKWVEKFQKLR